MGRLSAVRAAVSEWIDRETLRSPARLVLATFALVVLIITGLLSLPAATVTGERIAFVDALFVDLLEEGQLFWEWWSGEGCVGGLALLGGGVG